MLAITPASFIDDGYDFGVMMKALNKGRVVKQTQPTTLPKRFIPILDRVFQT
ncbi:MAG: hypothetical protein R3193_03410 [Marinobacter sp.]|nr:hypothetical protein [Marinobacter sp.]